MRHFLTSLPEENYIFATINLNNYTDAKSLQKIVRGAPMQYFLSIYFFRWSKKSLSDLAKYLGLQAPRSSFITSMTSTCPMWTSSEPKALLVLFCHSILNYL